MTLTFTLTVILTFILTLTFTLNFTFTLDPDLDLNLTFTLTLTFSFPLTFTFILNFNNKITERFFLFWLRPQVPLEEQLDAEQLESLRKYQERKQQKQTHGYPFAQVQQVWDHQVEPPEPPEPPARRSPLLCVPPASDYRSSHRGDL